MLLKTLFKPHEALTDHQREFGLKVLKFQTIAGSGADGLASGGFLAAFALVLGASNVHIGIMTAIPFIMQPVQIAAVGHPPVHGGAGVAKTGATGMAALPPVYRSR